MLLPARVFLPLLAILSTTASAQQLTAVKIDPIPAGVGQPLKIVVEVGPRPRGAFVTVEIGKGGKGWLACGMSMAMGDGRTKDIRVNENEIPVKVEHTYAAPGSYVIVASGKLLIRGLHSVLPCAGSVQSEPIVVQAGVIAQAGAAAASPSAPVSAAPPAPAPPASVLAAPTAAASAAVSATPPAAATSAVTQQAPSTSAARPAPEAVPSSARGAEAPNVSSVPASGAQRAAAPFTGYSESEQCEQKAFVQPGVPWRLDGTVATSDVMAAGTDLQYYAALRNTMRNLRVFYGGLSTAEERTFNAFWAPFFDHPTKAAFDYFQQVNVVLDDYLVTKTNLEGLLPAFSEGFQDYLLSSVFLHGPDEMMQRTLTAAQYEEVKAQRKKLDALQRQFVGLGNPPNPLAIKCGTRTRHAKALEATKNVTAARVSKPVDAKGAGKPGEAGGKGARSSGADMAWVLQNMEKIVHTSGPQYYPKLVHAAEGRVEFTKPEIENNKDKIVTLTANWTQLPRTVRPNVSYPMQLEMRRNGRFISAVFSREGTAVQPDDPARDERDRRAPWLKLRSDLPWQGLSSFYLCCTEDDQQWPSDNRLNYTAPPLVLPDGEREGQVYRIAVQLGASTSSGDIRPDLAVIFGYTYRWERATPEEPAEPEPVVNDDEETRKARVESIAQHEAIARQIDENAAKFEADAGRETKDPTRRAELLRIASDMRENAQAERDLAASLRLGIIVHTRTAGDERRHNQLVADIRQELAGLDRERTMLNLIPRSAALIEDAYGVKVRSETEQRVREALKSKNREAALSKIYTDIKTRVVSQAEVKQAQAEQKAEAWTEYIEEAEVVKSGATMALMIGTLGAPLGAVTSVAAADAAATGGYLMLGYSTTVGYTEDGVIGAGKAAVRGVSPVADVLISSYEGATRIDPATGKPRGVWGAVDEGLTSAGLNVGFGLLGAGIEQLTKMKFAAGSVRPTEGAGAAAPRTPAQERAASQTALEAQGAGGRGREQVAKATGEGRIKEFDFKSSEQRYHDELALAKTDAERALVQQKYEVVVRREKMHEKMDAATKRANEAMPTEARNPDGSVNQNDPRVKDIQEGLNNELAKIQNEYAESGSTDRNRMHEDALKETGLAMEVRDKDGNVTVEGDMALSGSKPKGAGNDIDLTVKGATPEIAYQNGRKYIQAMKKNGHKVIEFGDRWVISDMDATVWKPGFGADLPGSSSFEAGVIFGTLPNSDKFGTLGGVERTTTGRTRDPYGAYLANMGKAVGAGLGKKGPKDLHVIGKSVSKIAEVSGVPLDPDFKAQLEALRQHQTPEQAGIVQVGASPEARQRQLDAFIAKAERVTQDAGRSAKEQSARNIREIESAAGEAMERAAASQSNEARKAALDEAFRLRRRGKSYEAGNDAALQTLQRQAPQLMGRTDVTTVAPPRPVSTSTNVASPTSGPSMGLQVNLAPLAEKLLRDRGQVTGTKAMMLNGKDPALGDLAARCKQGADLVTEKLKSVAPGSDESKHLLSLKATLERGTSNPAVAVQETRLVTGYELSEVLRQLNRGTVRR